MDNDEAKKLSVAKEAAKSFVKGLTFGSVFDPDMTEEKANTTKEFTDKEILNHLTGKKKLTDQEVEELKTSSKYRRNL